MVLITLSACQKKDPNAPTNTTMLPDKVAQDLQAAETVVEIEDPQETQNNGNSNSETANSGVQNYSNEMFQFEFVKPTGWEESIDQLGTLVAYMEPVKEGDDFQANVNVVAQHLTQELEVVSLDDHVQASIAQVKPFFDSLEIVSEESSMFGGEDSRLVTLLVVREGVELKLTQRIVFHNNIVYVITYAAATTEYDEYFDKFKIIENTFRFKG